jgi:hypothetical protein
MPTVAYLRISVGVAKPPLGNSQRLAILVPRAHMPRGSRLQDLR